MNAALTIEGLTVHYRRRPVLVGVDYTAPRGSWIAVVGPNGAGKSTLLKAVMGIVPATTGSIRLLGRELDEVRDRVAYVPQREAVDWDFPVTAHEVVTMGLYGRIGWLRRIRKEHRRRADEALERVGLTAIADRCIGQLSGGQQQRVFLARALVQDPELFLLDEALAGVDIATEELLLELFGELRGQGKTVVMVHHDLDTVRRHCDQALLLSGRRIAAGSIEHVLAPQTLREAYGERLLVVEVPSQARVAAGR